MSNVELFLLLSIGLILVAVAREVPGQGGRVVNAFGCLSGIIALIALILLR